MAKKFSPDLEPAEQYGQRVVGFFGEFGGGGNAQCSFLQTGMSVDELKKIDLVSEIRGSEKWPVRTLFQREVDEERVGSGIIPYFKSGDKVKFFNPLTLTLLPKDIHLHKGGPEPLPPIERSEVEEKGKTMLVSECPELFRFKFQKNHPEYCELEWNDRKVRLVAIDGQHRLSALKRCSADPSDPSDSADSEDLRKWTVPAVVLTIHRVNPDAPAGSLMDFVRNIFVYINSTAREINPSRTILLSDENVNMVCVQELLEHSHANDCKTAEKRDTKITPLLFFDWRGLEKREKRIQVPGTLYSLEEVHDWFFHYVLGEPFSDAQEVALEVQPVTKALKRSFKNKHLDMAAAEELRKHFRNRVLPGLSTFLQGFRPFEEYIAGVRKYETELAAEDDLYRHAFYELRFGANQAGPQHQKRIQEILDDEIVRRLTLLKTKVFSEPIRNDVGIRGVMYAFGELKKHFGKFSGKAGDWLTYSKWFTRNVNLAYDDRWLNDRDLQKKKLRLHLTYDHEDRVCNYRLEHAEKALGPFVCCILLRYSNVRENTPSEEELNNLFEQYLYPIEQSIVAGYRRYWRPRLKEEGYDMGPKLNAAVRKNAERDAKKQIKRIIKALDKIS